MEFFLLSLVSLFAIINPFSTIPAFLSITPGDSDEERVRMAKVGCLVAAGLLLVFGLAGQWLFQKLGVTLTALQIGGGIILFVIGFEMLRAPDLNVRLNDEEKALAKIKDDIAITPLAIPLLCGPGAISTVIILQTQAADWAENLALLCSIPFVYLGCYVLLRMAVAGARCLNPIMLRILRRIMGLLFVVIAAQFCINGLEKIQFIHVPPGP